jgi:ketosteroid isomerase-like protein
MRKFLMLSSAVFLMTVPAMAADMKQELEKTVTSYMEGVAKQDGAAIAALYVAKDPIWIGPNGEIKTDIKATYEENFKNGENKIVSKIDKIWVQSDDAALVKGTVDVTFGKDPPIPAYWSGVYVREGGQMKIKMLTVGIKPPPPPQK